MTDLSLQEKTRAQSPAISSGKWWTSFVLLGVVLFALSDLSLRSLFQPEPTDTAYRSWIASAVADYPKSGKKPQIVILGSSLVVATVNDGDATTLGEAIDGTLHHRSITLEKAIAQATDRPVDRAPLSQSFAIGGQMASDAYAILRTLFNSDNDNLKNRFVSPKIIVWGIAPRDFMDATFTDPDTSSTVMYLDNLTANHDALGTRKPYIWRQMEYLADALFYAYGERDHFVVLQKQVVYGVLARLGLVKAEEIGTVKTPQELLRIARRELPEDNGLHQWMVKPQQQAISQFEDNSKEYSARYNPYKEKLFMMQLSYLHKFLVLSKLLGIKVVLVNMPLTQENLNLIPAGRYKMYLDAVKNLAVQNQATVLDYNDGKLFGHEFFNDPVHLNGYGSQRFFQMVGKEISKGTKFD